MKKKRHIGRILVVMVLVFGCIVGGRCYYNSQNRDISISQEDMIEPIYTTIEKKIKTKGTVKPFNLVDCHTYVSSTVLSTEIEIGDYIHKGDKMYELDKSEIEKEIKKQENAVESAIYSRKQAEGYEWEIRRLSVEDAQMALDDLNSQLKYYEIDAPISGIITEKKFQNEDYCNKNDVMATIADVSQYLIDVEVYEDAIGKINVGQDAFVTIPSINYETIGKVNRINPNGKTENGITYYTVTVVLPRQEESSLFLGMNAKVSFTEEKHENILAIPAYLISENSTVYIVNDPDSCTGEYRKVEIGLSDGDFVEIISGLQEGEKILVNTEKYAGHLK